MLSLADKVIPMEQTYWLKRGSVAAMMAKRATSAEARLIHFELSGRYSVKAAHAADASRPEQERG